jgi:quercetin dioxygenase-like cupin family protein
MYALTKLAADVESTALGFPGVAMKMLTSDGNTDGMYVLTTMAAGSTIPAHSHSGANEFAFVISGDFVEAGVAHGPGTYVFGLAGTPHGPHTSKTGCTVLMHFSAPLDFSPAT